MELKRQITIGKSKREILLIVPYGIETREPVEGIWSLKLLIVPYGIETTIGILPIEIYILF